jgi:hypothetical protein
MMWAGEVYAIRGARTRSDESRYDGGDAGAGASQLLGERSEKLRTKALLAASMSN